LTLVPTGGSAQRARDDDDVSIGAAEVVVDVVVRDAKGRIVKDLSAADFEIAEDGVAQDISSFRLVSRAADEVSEPAPESAPAATATPAAPTRRGPAVLAEDSPAEVSAVAIVFDRLAHDARVRARDAASKFVKESLRTDDLVGVFVTDFSLRVLQPFTRDPELVRKAVDAVAYQQTSNAVSNAEQMRTLSQRVDSLQDTQTSLEGSIGSGGQGGGAAAAAAGAAIGANAAELIAAEMTRRSLETFESIDRDQQGYATTDGLLAVVDALGRVPGRKAIVFFSEGIAIPSNVQPHFLAVIGNANRANVSIYTVDAAGLRVVSSTSETARELNEVGRRRLAQVESGSDDLPSLTRILERNEDMIRSDPEGTLGRLAAETGGFLVSGTNDPATRLRQVDEDLRTHYVLAYAPKNQDFDGQFRRIAIRVRTPGLEVRAREGYYAVGAIGSLAVLPFEARPLAMLAKREGASDFPYGVAALSFPEPGRDGRVPILVQVPASALTGQPDPSGKTLKTDFAVVAVVRDSEQRIVRKLSRHYELTVQADQAEAFRKGNVLFFRETTLAPGTYSVETIAYDTPSGRSSVGKRPLVVLPDGKLRLSSLLVVDRVERLKSDDRIADNSLRVGDMLLYPNLGTPLSKLRDKKITFFATLYKAPQGPSPKLFIQILQNGRLLASVPAELPDPDAAGRIQFANAFPLETMSPGAYVLKLTASDGRIRTSSSASFVVKP
jgi:VWFA-related protein